MTQYRTRYLSVDFRRKDGENWNEEITVEQPSNLTDEGLVKYLLNDYASKGCPIISIFEMDAPNGERIIDILYFTKQFLDMFPTAPMEPEIARAMGDMFKRIDAAYANDPKGRTDAYLRIAWIVGHCPTDSLVELVVACFPFIQQ